MSEIQLKATSVEDKPVRIGDLPIIKTNILENARQMDKGVVGGYNGAFPLTAASEGGIYLLPSTGKFYVCETAYNGSQLSAPNSNFVELSVWKNHDRFLNLINTVKLTFSHEVNTWIPIPYPQGFTKDNCFIIIQDVGVDNTGGITFKVKSDQTSFCAISVNEYRSFAPLIIFIKK